jgi:hypothetical protein
MLLALQITSELFSPLYSQWLADTEALRALETNGAAITDDHRTVAERWRFCLKALRRLVCFGFLPDSKSLVDVDAVAVVMPVLLHTTQSLMSVLAKGEAHPLHETLTKGVLKLVKTAMEVGSYRLIHIQTLTNKIK